MLTPYKYTPTFYGLQIGRGLAALAVVVHHCAALIFPHYPDFPKTLYQLLYLGYFGVDFFFVLSGFIIAYATLGPTRVTVKEYAVARWLRVYIPYYPVTLAMLLALTLLPQVSLTIREHYSVFGSLTLLPSNTRPVLGVAWTLQHEIMFYLLFALCHFGLRDWRYIFLWAVPIALLHGNMIPRSMILLFGITNLEFLFGCAAYYCYTQQWFKNSRGGLFLLGCLIVTVTLNHFYNAEVTNYRIAAAAGFSCILLAAVYYEASMHFAACRRLVFLGAASYAIYLTHMPLITLLMHLPQLFSNWEVALAVSLSLSVIGGVLFHLLHEKPVLRFLRKLTAAQKWHVMPQQSQHLP